MEILGETMTRTPNQTMHRMSAPLSQFEHLRLIERVVSSVTLPPALIGDLLRSRDDASLGLSNLMYEYDFA